MSARFGRLDALVNNAGIAVFAPLLETSDEDWSRVLQVNLTGPFLCTKAAAPLMREHGGGAIVNITSISAVRASTLRSAYGTSKAGLAHLTKQLAVELASLGIRVNARGARPGRNRDGEAGAHAGNPRRLSRRHSAQSIRPRGGTGGSDLLPVQRSLQLHHRADSRPSTAVSTPPASACRPCAARGGTDSVRPHKRAANNPIRSFLNQFGRRTNPLSPIQP